MQLLGGISREEFLKQYWQKKPLLIRQAFPDYQSPISAEELGGLACEEGVESRLIQEQGGNKPWQLRHGPFVESDFVTLPESHWTLLIQSIDHHIPELAVLLDEFNFIPNWRVDDLMVSFAQTQGSVGAHLDNYDVFLLQVQGQRHWHINEKEYSDNDFMSDCDLRILKEFSSEQNWILEPGDMLYLPPGVAHHGIALDDCMTFSIGFRAPNRKDLLYAYTGNINDSIEDAFYSDPGLKLQGSAGEIIPEHINAIRQLMLNPESDAESFNSWFGCFITEKTNDLEFDNEDLSEKEFRDTFIHVGRLMRNGNIRISYINYDESLSLFLAGEEYSLSRSYLSLVNALCEQHFIDYNMVVQCCDESAALELLFKLYDSSYYYFYE
jgi:50S ribosomal protein L16 3-hydroxylase